MVPKEEKLSDVSLLRLENEKKNLREKRKTFPEGFSLKPGKKGFADDLSEWRFEFKGRPSSIWEGPIYRGWFRIKENYPTQPPVFQFDKVLEGDKPLQHINVFQSGDICLDVMKKAYNSERTLLDLALAIENMLYKPNEKDPANGTLANLYKKNVAEYEAAIREQSKKIKERQDASKK